MIYSQVRVRVRSMLRKWRRCTRSSEWLTTRRLWKAARRWPADCVCSPPSCRPWSSQHLLGSLEMKRPISSSTLRHHSAAARCTCRDRTNNARAAWLLGAERRSRAPQGVVKSSFSTPLRTNESPRDTGCWTSAHSNKMPLPTRLISKTFQSHTSLDLSLHSTFDAIYSDAKVNKTRRDKNRWILE